MTFLATLQGVANCISAAGLPLGVPGTLILGSDGAGASQPCCENGGLLRVEMVEAKPQDDERNVYGRVCDLTFEMLGKVTVLRCWPSIKANGGAPPATDVLDAGVGLVGDAEAALTALACCPDVVSIRQVTFVEPEGGCAGFEIEFWSDVQICC